MAAAFFGAAPPASAGVPEWLRAVAREPLPAYPKETTAVILHDEQVTTVKDNGEIETLYRRAYKILRPEGRDFGTVVVFFNSETRLNYLKAWSIPADGKEYEVKEKDAVETGMSSELYSDIRHKVLRIPAADPGNVVGYEYIQKRRPFILQDSWNFQYKIPVRRARFTLLLPSGWEYDAHWFNAAPKEPQAAGRNQFVWEVANVPPVVSEPDMPPFQAVVGRLAVNYFPRDASQASKAHGSWREVGLWYQQLAGPSRAVTPGVKQKVAELTANAPASLDKIKALASFLQREIRYVAIEIGIGGYQPHAAADTFAHKYGDCKDKAALLSTMLREVGVESYFVLIHTDRGIVQPQFPTALAFNHAILALRLPESVASSTLYATMNHPKLGRLLFFDPTNSFTPLGYLPWYLQDSYGLLVTPEGGELVDLPLLPPTTNRLLRTAKLTLSPSGALTGEVQEVRSGGPAVSKRAQFLQAAAVDRKKVLEDFLGGFLPGFTLTSASIGNLEKYDDSLTLQYRFRADRYAKQAGNLLLLRPRVLGEKASDLLEGHDRKYPVEFDEATLQSDSFEITLPPGFVVDDVPPPVKVTSDFGEYRSQVEVTENQLRYSRTYEIKSVIVPPQKLGDLRQFYRQIAADERASAVLRRAN